MGAAQWHTSLYRVRQNDLPNLKLPLRRGYWLWMGGRYVFEQQKPCHFCCHHGVEWWTSCICNWNLVEKNLFWRRRHSDSYIPSLCRDVTKLPGAETQRAWKCIFATVHTARASTEVLRENFPGRLISLCGDISWLARSPDPSSCDFFLWGYLKAEVFKCRPQTTDELKDAIRHKITAIPEVMTRRALQNCRVRLQECIARDGKHLHDIIFKKKWRQLQNKMANIVLSYSEIKFWIGSMLPFLFTFQNREIILPDPVVHYAGKCKVDPVLNQLSTIP
jgi:hypothetical protein